MEELTSRDTLDTTTTRETSDRGLCNTLDVVTKNLSVALGTALAQTLAALAASSHDERWGGRFVVVVVVVVLGGQSVCREG